MIGPWSAWVTGLLGLVGTLALLELCVLFLVRGSSAAAGEDAS